MKQVNTIIKQLHLESLDRLRQPFSKILKIKNSQLIVIIYLAMLILNAFGFFRAMTLFSFGFIYPAQKTAQVFIKHDSKKSNKWLAYWLFAALILIFDQSLSIIPLFQAAEPLILFYLWYPKYQIAEIMMNKLVQVSTFDVDQIPSQLFKPNWYQKIGMALSENKLVNKVVEKVT